MKQHKLPPALRARLKAAGLTMVAHQPVRLFRTARRLALVPEACDPWSVTLYREGLGWSTDVAGHAERDSLVEAVEAALGARGLRSALDRLARESDALTAVLRA